MIAANGSSIGHIRIFARSNNADDWLKSMRDRTNVWAYWRFGQPLGPFAPDEMYRSADGIVQQIAVFELDATSQPAAAKEALERFKGELHAAISFYEG
jgi:hypothetical protein